MLRESRFRGVPAGVWSTGFRVHEIRKFTKNHLTRVLTETKFSFYQAKVNEMWCFLRAPLCKKLEKEIHSVFQNHTHLSGTLSNHNWIKFINQGLKKHLLNFTFKRKLHSFPINYVTQILKKVALPND